MAASCIATREHRVVWSETDRYIRFHRADAEHILAHDPDTTLRLNAALRTILDLHWTRLTVQSEVPNVSLNRCGCGHEHPCPTVTALADALTPRWRES